MIKKILLVILINALNAELGFAQVAQFPQVYYNGQGAGGANIYIHQSASYPSANITLLSTTSNIGAALLTVNSSDAYFMNWVKVCLPGTSGSIEYGYIACDEFYARISETNNYATVTATSLNIRPCAGCTGSNVTIGGQNALFGQNSIVALTGNSSSGWYEVHLTMNCSQLTGWVSGTYLSIASPQSYYVLGGRVCDNAANCAFLGDINGATVTLGSLATTYSSADFYQYKVPVGWLGNITCTHPSYNTSSPSFYSYTATGHDYSKQFVLSNSGCTFPSTPTVNTPSALSTSVTLSWTDVSASNYTVFYSTSGCQSGSYNTYSSTSPNATITGLAPSTLYYFWVQANNSTCYSGLSGCQTATTTSGVTCTGFSVVLTPSLYSNGFNTICNSQGTITANINAGTSIGPYNYTWSPPNANSPFISNLFPMQYDLTVTDGQGCTTQNSITLTQLVQEITSVTLLHSDCSSSILNDGTAEVNTVVGGVPPYTFLWSPGGSTNSQITGLAPGTYSVTVTDGTGCTYVQSVTVGISSSVTVTVNSSSAAPWQRANESYDVTMDATTSDNSQWYIVAHDVNGFNSDQQSGPYNSNSGIHSTTFTFSNPTSAIVYYAQNTGTSISSNISSQTEIIESKWINKNLFYFNQIGNDLKIPLRYDPNATSISVYFTRDNSASDAGSADNLISGGSITLNGNNNQYLTLPNNLVVLPTVSNIINVAPGIFSYLIVYNNGNNIPLDEGRFDLTKIGNYGGFHSGNDTLIVLVGGNRNSIEQNIQSLTGTDPDMDFSIAQNFNYLDATFNTWYIAQSNTNYIEDNAYDLGKGLDAILQICQNNGTAINHIHIICHSKGGLEVRSMLGGLGRKLDGTYSGYPNNPLIESVTFLATPHSGLLYGSSDFVAGNAYDEITNGSQFLNTLDNSILPSTIRFLNVTGNDPAVWFNITAQPNDGLVPVWSSKNPSLKKGTNTYIAFPSLVQLFVSYNVNRSFSNSFMGLHTTIHHTSILNTSLDVCDLSFTNLNRIFEFIRGRYVQDCQTLPNSNMQYVISGSILSGALINLKRLSDTSYSYIGMTDENGMFSESSTSNFSIGDSIKIVAPGYETIFLEIDSAILFTGKIELSMLKSFVPTIKIKYATLKFTNQNPITSTNQITLEVTGQNILSYEINNPFNQDTTFIPLTLNSNQLTAQLDTGSNVIVIRLIGLTDTVLLAKQIFYFPNSMMNNSSYNISISADSFSIGTKVYVNNQFIKEVNSFNDTIPVLIGENTIMFSKFGYVDSVLTVDSATAINISLQLFAHSYSSLTDSNIIDLTSPQAKIQYRKNVTVLDSAQQSIISLKQYDDTFSGFGLIPKCRKFEITHINAPWSDIRFASVLDQIENLSVDSIYMLRIFDDTSFTKIQFDTSAIVAGYDSLVQKLTYNYINFDSGTATKEALVIMKKQPPVVNAVSNFSVNTGDSITILLSQLFSDPDSLHGDMTFSLTSAPNGITVSINNGIVTVQTIPCFSGSTSFTINAMHDELTVANIINVTVIGSPPPVISSSRNIFCIEDSAILTVTSALSYQWLLNGTAINGETDSVLTVISSGNYSVTITDNNGCTSTSSSIAISQYPAMGLPLTSTDLLCNDDASGTASINTVLLGGTPPYSYSWSNGASTSFVSGLGAGGITATITDSNGCSVDTAFSISEPPPMNSIISSTPFFCGFGVSCHGLSDGAINLSPGGGTPPYSFSWNGGTYTTEDLNNVPAGVYNVLITDMNGCTQSDSFTITEPATLVVNISSPVNALGHNISCFGASTGIIHTAVTGGCAQYTFDWGFGPVSADSLANLPAAFYLVSVVDQNGCSSTDTITLAEPSEILLTLDSTSSTCGQNNGAAQITPSGGDAPYLFLWSNGATTSSISGLFAGAYSVTVTDSNGCPKDTSIIIDDISDLSAISQPPQNVSCHGGNDGEAIVTPAGGTPPYFYAWSPVGGSDSIASNLTIGNYSCSIEDASGCIITMVNITISEPVAIEFQNITLPTIHCFGGNDGEISYTMYEGTPPFTFLWNDGDTNQTRINLIAGTYIVTATDANSCVATDTFTVTQEDQIIPLVSNLSQERCIPDSTGSFIISATGGVGSFQYSIDGLNFQLSGLFQSLVAGVYSVIVRDSNNCVVSIADTISHVTPQNGLSYTQNQNTLISPYSNSQWFTINNTTIPFSTDSITTCLSMDSTYVVGTDSNGCDATSSLDMVLCTVGINSSVSLYNGVQIFPNPATNEFVISCSECNQSSLVDIFNSVGEKIYSSTFSSESLTVNCKVFSQGIYFVELKNSNQILTRKLVILK